MKARFLVGLAGLFLVVACGSSENESPSNPDTKPPAAQPPAKQDPAPSQPGYSCVAPAPIVASRVYHVGAQGASTNFPDATKAYLGTVKTRFSNGTFLIDWETSGIADSIVTHENIRAEGLCDPDMTGRRVVYQGTASTRFPSPEGGYLGTVKHIYAGGFAEIDWDHLSENTVEPFNGFAFEF